MDTSDIFILVLVFINSVQLFVMWHMGSSRSRIFFSLMDSIEELKKWKTVSGLKSNDDITPEMAADHWNLIKLENQMLRDKLESLKKGK